MADYAGALAAIRARLVAGWSTTRITFANEQPADPWPPRDGSNVLQAWVHMEIASEGSEVLGTGQTGAHTWTYEGTIMVHVFVPVGMGTSMAFQHAVAIGELFRAAKFYDATPGHAVRTLAPEIDGGGSADDDGDWFRVTMSCPFTYWHRG